MNEAIINTYLNVLQEGEPEYMTEGLREFLAKFDKAHFKRYMDKLYNAFTKGDASAFEDIAKKSIQVGKKMPKYKEIEMSTKSFKDDNPDYGKAVELSKKVIRNTFKIKDKAKLEMIGNAVAMTGWIKSKGGRKDVLRETKVTLQNINSQVSSVYDTGFESYEASTPEEEEMKKKFMAQSKKQEKSEMIVVGVIISVLVASVIWAGIAIWGFFTSPAVMVTITVVTFMTLLLKTLAWAVGIAATIAVGAISFTKATGK